MTEVIGNRFLDGLRQHPVRVLGVILGAIAVVIVMVVSSGVRSRAIAEGDDAFVQEALSIVEATDHQLAFFSASWPTPADFAGVYADALDAALDDDWGAISIALDDGTIVASSRGGGTRHAATTTTSLVDAATVSPDAYAWRGMHRPARLSFAYRVDVPDLATGPGQPRPVGVTVADFDADHFTVMLDADPQALLRVRTAADSSTATLAFLLALLVGAVLVLIRQWKRRADAVAEQHRADARTDSLTGLPNRLGYQEALAAYLCDDGPSRMSVFLLDLDRFKQVNDSLGHDVGDQLLIEVARRLRTATLPGDFLARLGGDEFAIVAPSVRSGSEALAYGTSLADAVGRPARIHGHLVEVGLSAGAALYPDDAVEPGDLLRYADIAMYAAKQSDRDVAVYSTELDGSSADDIALTVELREAIALDQLELAFQPIVDAVSRAPNKFEALARWRHPQRGLLQPAAFIHLAADGRLAGDLTIWAIDRAVRHCVDWVGSGLDLSVSVNIFPTILTDLSFPARVGTIIRRHRIDPARLWLEVTEEAGLTVDHRVREVLRQLGDLGVSVSIDDFGSGAWSLAHVRQLPVRTVKIDRSLVQAAETSEDDLAVVEYTAGLLKKLGFRVVAEGIENEALAVLLTRLGADELQGYGISRPIPAAHVPVYTRAFDPPPAPVRERFVDLRDDDVLELAQAVTPAQAPRP